MLREKNILTLSLLVVPMLLVSQLTSAEEAATSGADWRFEFSPYMFFTGLDGTVGVRGVKADIDASFSDLENLLSAGYMGIFEANKGRWIFALEGLYVKLENEDSKTGNTLGALTIDVEVGMTQEIYQGSVGYRVLDKRTKVDLFGAARYTNLESDVKIKLTSTGPILPGGKFKVDGSKSWTDPVIGVRVLHPVGEHWTFVGLLDAGGFGVSGDIDRTYQGIAGVNWQFSKHFAAKAGYRYLYQNYQDDGFVWDMVMQGPYVALGIQF